MDTETTGAAFVPVVGKCYEIHFGELTHKNQTGYWKARIRVEGEGASSWIDLDIGVKIDPELAAHVVQAFREIPCPKE